MSDRSAVDTDASRVHNLTKVHSEGVRDCIVFEDSWSCLKQSHGDWAVAIRSVFCVLCLRANRDVGSSHGVGRWGARLWKLRFSCSISLGPYQTAFNDCRFSGASPNPEQKCNIRVWARLTGAYLMWFYVLVET